MGMREGKTMNLITSPILTVFIKSKLDRTPSKSVIPL